MSQQVHMIMVVGLIRAVDVTSTKITYTIDDTTGLIDAVQWIDADQVRLFFMPQGLYIYL